MKIIKWIFGHFEDVISTVLIIIVFFALGASVVGRWLGIPTSSLQEVYRYAFVGAILFGISSAAKDDEHIRADIITGSVSQSVREKILFVADIIWLLFSLALAWYGTFYVIGLTEFIQFTPILHIPIWMLQAMVPISSLLASIRIAQNIIGKILKFKKQKKERSR